MLSGWPATQQACLVDPLIRQQPKGWADLWFENECEGGEAGAGGLAAPILNSICSLLIKSL